MATCLHKTLTCARVLYIGKAAPTPCHEGLNSIQKPLSELYQKPDRQKAMQDQEIILYAFSSGLLAKPVNRLDKEIWLRIQDLESCSAVKAYRDNSSCSSQITFVPTDSPAGQSVDSPSIFTVIMRRGEGLKISDCHAFLCFSDETAMLLVKSCQYAFGNRSGWTTERPNLVELGLERAEVKEDNECYVDDAKDDCGPEYYQKPKLSGFFYAPRSDLIQKYKIGGEDGFGRLVSDDQPVIEHFTHCEPEPEPEPSCGCSSGPCIHIVHVTQPAIADGGYQGYQADPQQQLMPAGYQQQQMVSSGYQQQTMMPQQVQMYYGSDAYGGMDKKAMKKAQKKQKQLEEDAWRGVYGSGGPGPVMNEYVTEEVRYVPQPSGSVYPPEPVYAKALPRGGRAEYRQDARMSGVGDYGPPGNMQIYSRQLPVDGFNVYSGDPSQQNFILRKSSAY